MLEKLWNFKACFQRREMDKSIGDTNTGKRIVIILQSAEHCFRCCIDDVSCKNIWCLVLSIANHWKFSRILVESCRTAQLHTVGCTGRIAEVEIKVHVVHFPQLFSITEAIFNFFWTILIFLYWSWHNQRARNCPPHYFIIQLYHVIFAKQQSWMKFIIWDLKIQHVAIGIRYIGICFGRKKL